MKRLIPASILAMCLLPFTAEAYTLGAQGTMCGKFFPGAFGCKLGSAYVEATHFDAEVSVYMAGQNFSSKLLIFFHGHGGTPEGSTDFLVRAAQLGYDVITLDYDYSRDYPPPAAAQPADADCGLASCDVGMDATCGCYTDCFGNKEALAWLGGSHDGLPSVNADWSVDTRLNRVVGWVVAHTGFPRFAHYLDPAQRGGINWSAVTVTGHSLGSDLAGYIGKWQAVDRVVMLSGPAAKMAPDVDVSAEPETWTGAHGCSNTAASGCGPGTSFPGCTCENTTYRYGNANGLGFCALTASPVGWVADNHFGSNTGKVWETPTSRIYTFEDANDHVAYWLAPMFISSHRNWLAMNLDARHDPGFANGWNQVGDFSSPQGLRPGNWHGVLSGTDPFMGQICAANNISGHNAVISDNACIGEPAASANRDAVWTFLLTH